MANNLMDLEIYKYFGQLAMENATLIHTEATFRLSQALEKHNDYMRRHLMLQEYQELFKKFDTDADASEGEDFCKCSDFKKDNSCIHVYAYGQIFGGLLREGGYRD